MSYSNITALNLIYSSPTFAPYDVLLEILIKSRSNSFQTQAGRDILREQLVNALQTVVTPITRFPADRWYVWSRNPTLGPVFEALLQATDTKNRIIETEEDSRPTTAETLNATQRVDDATVAIHKEIDNILGLLQGGTAVYNQASFEIASGWTWTAPAN
nr:coat protein [Hibiscus latent Fort Pierce virus]WJE88256.1 18 kDa coat protein [Hibiscus latent Fort Pierce virus]